MYFFSAPFIPSPRAIETTTNEGTSNNSSNSNQMTRVQLTTKRIAELTFLIALLSAVQTMTNISWNVLSFYSNISNNQNPDSDQEMMVTDIVADELLTPNRTSNFPTASAIGTIELRSETKEHQIENYRNGKGMIVNIHITHHAGTSFCHAIGHATDIPASSTTIHTSTSPSNDGKLTIYNRTTPSFACMGDNSNKTHGLFDNPRNIVPWNGENETDHWIGALRPYFHMISVEYGDKLPLSNRPLSRTHWENPNLVSVLIVRHPIDRILALDMSVHRKFPALTDSDRKYWNIPRINDSKLEHRWWWEYINNSTDKLSQRNTNNFALRVLSYEGKYEDKPDQNYNKTNDNHVFPPTWCKGKDTDPKYLERAKNLVSRFTFVLDQTCLNEGIRQVGDLLGITLGRKYQPSRTTTAKKSYRERIGFDDVYDFLVEKNKLDIELYEWAADRSLVRCKNLIK